MAFPGFPWRKRREELVAELGEELVEWGERLASVLEDLPPDDGRPKPDDSPPPAQPTKQVRMEREVRDRNGKLMPCIICQSRATVDGRYCRRHSP